MTHFEALADPATCTPVYLHRYLRVNTIFEVARQAGLRTAWADKHPAYEMSAKHEQSPQQPQALARIPDGPILDGLNAAWKAAYPAAAARFGPTSS
jgi:hypothetical protein